MSYLSSRLANIADLELDAPLDVSYPDAEAPGVLLKLGAPVAGGAGPDGDIVGFTTLCPPVTAAPTCRWRNSQPG